MSQPNATMSAEEVRRLIAEATASFQQNLLTELAPRLPAATQTPEAEQPVVVVQQSAAAPTANRPPPAESPNVTESPAAPPMTEAMYRWLNTGPTWAKPESANVSLTSALPSQQIPMVELKSQPAIAQPTATAEPAATTPAVQPAPTATQTPHPVAAVNPTPQPVAAPAPKPAQPAPRRVIYRTHRSTQTNKPKRSKTAWTCFFIIFVLLVIIVVLGCFVIDLSYHDHKDYCVGFSCFDRNETAQLTTQKP